MPKKSSGKKKSAKAPKEAAPDVPPPPPRTCRVECGESGEVHSINPDPSIAPAWPWKEHVEAWMGPMRAKQIKVSSAAVLHA